jgi:hypothetical protein
MITKSINIQDSVQKSFRMTGLYPLNRLVILGNCSSWSKTQPQAEDILAVTRLSIARANRNGWVTDPEIHAEVGVLVYFGPPLKSAYTVFNQWCACWDNQIMRLRSASV